MKASILQTIEQVLTLSGALVEQAGEDALEVIAPPDVAAALKIPEHATLYSNPLTAPKGSLVLAYTPELFEQLMAILNHRGYLTQCIAKDIYVKRSGVPAAVEGAFTILNGIGRVNDYNEKIISYFLCHFSYTALSDERKEGIVAAAVNEFSGVPTTELSMVLSSQLPAGQPGSLPADRKPVVETYRAACLSAQQAIERELVPFRRSLARRLKRDIERLHDYYGSLITEIEERIRRRKLEGREREAEQSRKEATRLEMQRKLVDQQERYAMEVKVRLINAARIYVPALVVRYQVQRRQLKREVQVIWNPLRKDFDDVECEGCRRTLRSFSLCDDRLHLVCADCFQCSQCGKVACHACHPARCPKCAAPRNDRTA